MDPQGSEKRKVQYLVKTIKKLYTVEELEHIRGGKWEIFSRRVNPFYTHPCISVRPLMVHGEPAGDFVAIFRRDSMDSEQFPIRAEELGVYGDVLTTRSM